MAETMLVESTTTEPMLGPDDRQRTWLVFARLFLGVGWIVEATIGRFWKWGSPTSGVNPEWVGDDAGAVITSTIEQALADGVWPWYGWVLENVALQNVELWSWLTSITQVLIGVGLILGLFTRVAALSGLAMLGSILLMGSFRTSPLLIALTLFVLLTGADRVGSIDRVLGERIPALRPVLTLGLESIVSRTGAALAAVATGLGVYFLLQQATRPAPRFVYVGQEYAVFLFAFAAAVVLVQRYRWDRLTVAAGMLRMYVGYKLLWWLWTAPQAALTSLPGFNDGSELEEVLVAGAETHLPLLDSIVETVVAPSAGIWALVFGFVQLAVGLMMLVGFRSRPANWAALILLGTYILLGFTRYAPYLAGMALITLALGSAPQLSFTRLVGGRLERPADPWRFRSTATVAVTAAAVVISILALATEITPNGYNDDAGSTVLWTLGVNGLALAAAGWLTGESDGGVVRDGP